MPVSSRQPRVKGSQDLVRYQIETNARDVLLSADKLIPKGSTTPLAIHGYDWSADGNRGPYIYELAKGLAVEHPRRLLGTRTCDGKADKNRR
jgi:hypothetical protein